jgi:hypothetical protein
MDDKKMKNRGTDLLYFCIMLRLFPRLALLFLSVCEPPTITLETLNEDVLLPELGFELKLGGLEGQKLTRGRCLREMRCERSGARLTLRGRVLRVCW